MLLCYCVVCCVIVFDLLLCVVVSLGCWFGMSLCCLFGVFVVMLVCFFCVDGYVGLCVRLFCCVVGCLVCLFGCLVV